MICVVVIHWIFLYHKNSVNRRDNNGFFLSFFLCFSFLFQIDKKLRHSRIRPRRNEPITWKVKNSSWINRRVLFRFLDVAAVKKHEGRPWSEDPIVTGRPFKYCLKITRFSSSSSSSSSGYNGLFLLKFPFETTSVDWRRHSSLISWPSILFPFLFLFC